MQYADVAVDSKTIQEDLFTYHIPAKFLPYIREGSLVQVPFSGRKLLGIVFKLKKTTRNIKEEKIKPIKRVIDPMPILDPIRLELAQEIKNYYLSPLGKVLFAMIPEPARREAAPEAKNLAGPRKKSLPPVIILGRSEFRLKKYQAIIEKTRKSKKQLLILLSGFNSSLKTRLGKNISGTEIYHAGLPTTKKYRLWQKAQRGKIKLLIGTRQALFLPLTNLGAIIIDNATSDLFKNDQEPFYDLRRVALQYSQLSGVRLFYGDLNPPLEFWPQIKAEDWPIIKERKREKKIKIVNLSRERGILSQPLKRALKRNLRLNQKSILFLNRLGHHRLMICLNCSHSQYLKPGQKTILRCPLCQSQKIRLSSLGTRGLARIVREEFPQAKTLSLDSQSSEKELGEAGKKDFEILIATSMVFNYNLEFQTVGIILPEISLAFPTYNVWEKSFSTLSQAASLGKEVIVQSFSPNQKIVSQAVRDDYQNFFLEELKRRKKSQEPPFGALIKLYSRGLRPIKELKEAKKELASWARTVKTPLIISDIIKPILIKRPYLLLKTKPVIPFRLKKRLLSLPNIKIDRDPKELF